MAVSETAVLTGKLALQPDDEVEVQLMPAGALTTVPPALTLTVRVAAVAAAARASGVLVRVSAWASAWVLSGEPPPQATREVATTASAIAMQASFNFKFISRIPVRKTTLRLSPSREGDATKCKCRKGDRAITPVVQVSRGAVRCCRTRSGRLTT